MESKEKKQGNVFGNEGVHCGWIILKHDVLEVGMEGSVGDEAKSRS